MEKHALNNETKYTCLAPVRGKLNQHAAHDARTALVKAIVEKENAARDAKTARLRALRLAKEKAERKAASDAAPKTAKAKPKARSAQIIRH